MGPITDLESQLRRDEGFDASAYKDGLGYLTIGIGFCIDKRKGCGLYEEEIDFILQNRLKQNAAHLSAAMPWTDQLDEVRRGAMLNMVYEMGLDGVAKFPQFIRAMEAKDYPTASAAMLDSLWARQQSPDRARRLSLQIILGVWQ